MYFMRIAPFYKRRATLIDGLEEDAAYVAECIRSRSAIGRGAAGIDHFGRLVTLPPRAEALRERSAS
jgi:hypothetical protein